MRISGPFGLAGFGWAEKRSGPPWRERRRRHRSVRGDLDRRGPGSYSGTAPVQTRTPGAPLSGGHERFVLCSFGGMVPQPAGRSGPGPGRPPAVARELGVWAAAVVGGMRMLRTACATGEWGVGQKLPPTTSCPASAAHLARIRNQVIPRRLPRSCRVAPYLQAQP